ncbi:MAG: DUF2505 family protein [Acidimicrobiales bacterium]
MRFSIEQRFVADVDAVARAYTDPALYVALVGLPKLSQPDVIGHEVDGDTVVLQVRYRFGGELSAAARAVIDPERLTWVERSTHDLARRHTTFTMVPDHYADRFSCRGSYGFEPTDAGCRRRGEGDLRVKALLVGGAVEGAIVSGLQEHLVDEVPVVEAFVAAQSL